MRSKTLTASGVFVQSGTIRGGSFLSGLALRDALLLYLHICSALPAVS